MAMKKVRSIYKSDEGREVMSEWYDHFLDRLGRERLEHVDVETRFGTTHVLIGGPREAPPLWCFHGAMATAPAALAQIPSLLEHFRVHFPDLVGQPGRSDETRLNWQGDEHGHWLVDVLDAFDVERATALGVSLGGYVVLRGASVAPDRIDRAVLWVPAGLVNPPLIRMIRVMWSGLAYAIFQNRSRLEAILGDMFTDFDDDYVEFFADSLAHVHPDRRFPATLADEALEDWSAPVMLVAHGSDPLFPAEPLVERAEEVIPRLERIRVEPEYSHMPPFEHSALDGLIDDLYEFVAGDSSET
jgi:pimeloyl-ACP methyl ester carboxylesterase